MADPARLRRPISRLNAATGNGFCGAPTKVSVPSRFSKLRYALMSWSADTASRMKWKLPACFCMSVSFFEITTSSAPSRRASPTLFADVVNSTTCAPSACANFTPICPNPPSPTMPTLWPLPTFQCRIGEYVVIPAQSNGAAPAGFKPLDTRSTNASSTTRLSEYPPYVTPPRTLSSKLYVSVKPFSQYCCSPARQLAHTRQESTMQPTAAMSPSLNFFTALPTFTTRPTISCPGTHGYTVGIASFHSLRAWCKSEWQTPQYKISICTSCARGSLRRRVNGASAPVGLGAAYALAVNVCGFEERFSFAGTGLAASLMSFFSSLIYATHFRPAKRRRH